MSSTLIVFPFKREDPNVMAANFDTAARHAKVDEVWGVAASEGASLAEADEIAAATTSTHLTPVEVFAQDRIGSLRPGKGDGMNTAIRRAASSGFDRIHFYDADITNFDESWIDGAETAADRGFEIVRHRFPRASTDAMITWMVTRPALAMTFPGTVISRLGQPLGGELLISGRVAERLAADPNVLERSDWGIDTVITHSTSTMGLPIYEHNVAQGKRHALYGSLDEIRLMVVECLDAARSLRGRQWPPHPDALVAEPHSPVPDDLKNTVGYDLDSTIRLLQVGWTLEESKLAETLPRDMAGDVLRNRAEPHFAFMDAELWGAALLWLLDHFRLGDPVMETLAFRLWLIRVLAYTTSRALWGYDAAIEYLESTIEAYEKQALRDR